MAVRTNRITNPSFETNATLWTANGSATLTRVTSQFYVGAASLQVAASLANAGAQSNAYTVGVGVPIVASMGLRYSSGATDIVVELRNQAGTVFASQAVTLTTAWQRVTLSGTTPAATTSVHIRTNRVAAAAHTYFVDAVILEQAATFAGYFDGATADNLVNDYAWTGTANLSTSTATELAPIAVTAYNDAAPSPRVDVVLASIPILGVTTTVERFWGNESAVVRGASRAVSVGGFTVTDYEVPLGVSVTYVATSYNVAGGAVSQSPVSTAVTITATSPRYAWVSDPLAPSTAVQVTMEAGTGATLTYQATTNVMHPIGRRAGIAAIGSRLSTAQLPFTILTLDANQESTFKEVLMQAGVILVRPATGVRLPNLCYLATPDAVQTPYLDPTVRKWDVSGELVSPPGSRVVVPFHTYAEVHDAYATYAALDAAKATYLAVLQDPV